MINWIKKKQEERRLRNWLNVALGHPTIKDSIRVGKSEFTMKDTNGIVGAGSKDRFLAGTYHGPWPTIMRARSEGLFELGTFTFSKSDMTVTLMAYIVSGRVVGFIFSSSSGEFVEVSQGDAKFEVGENCMAQGCCDRLTDFPAWLPQHLLVTEEISKNYRFPEGYADEDAGELFRWFEALQCGEYLLTRPDFDDETAFFGNIFLIVGQDDCGNYLALSRAPESKLLLLEHSSIEPTHIEGGVRKLIADSNTIDNE